MSRVSGRRRAPPGTVRGVETFAVGAYPGDREGEVWEYGLEDLEAIERNFAALSSGRDPLHRVPVVVTHDGTHAYGWVSRCRRAGGLVVTDWRDVAAELRRAIRSGSVRKVSAEVKRDFTDRHGRVYPGCYLYRVAVLGADVPRIKGLADIPADEFSDRQPGRVVERVFRFTDPGGRVMTRDQAIGVLSDQLGIDPATITPDVPDAFLIAVATALQGEETDEGDLATPATPRKTAMSDGGSAGGSAGRAPVQETITRKFAEKVRRELRAEVESARAEIRAAREAAGRERQAREQREAAERQAQVRIFCDHQAKAGRLSPADNDEGSPHSVRSRLLRLAAGPQAVHKFADASGKGEVEKSELQLQQEEVERREPRRFSERVPAGPAQGDDAYAKKCKEFWAERAKRAAANN